MTATSTDKKGMKWGIERRLELIEFRLFWEGGVNRSDIVDEFGVSVPQASKDLALYQEEAPHNLRYDRSQKRYFASSKFSPRFIALNADAYLANLVTQQPANDKARIPADAIATIADRLPIPQRRIDSDVLRSLLGCVREKRSIEIHYQSMAADRPEPIWRRITPHAFASDGLRWHTRAFCHRDGKFKDFILSRCQDTRSPDKSGALPSDDTDWTTYFSVALGPNPRLSKSQQDIVAEDYAMDGGEAIVPVRRALLYYFNKRLRLDVADRFDNPSEVPVVVKNRNEFGAALRETCQ